MNTIERVNEIAASVAQQHGLFLIDTVLRGDNRKRIVEIYIDGRLPVSAETCALISREIGDELEASDVFSSGYRLEVSSPGVDRPLKYLEQYHKHINRKFEIEYASQPEQQESEPETLTGKLASVNGEELTFIADNKETTINYNTIKSAKVLISF